MTAGVKTFRFEATVLEPEGLPSEARDACLGIYHAFTGRVSRPR